MCGRVVIEHRCMIGNKLDSELIVYYTRKTEPDRLPAAVKLFADLNIHKMSVSGDTYTHTAGVLLQTTSLFTALFSESESSYTASSSSSQTEEPPPSQAPPH